MPHLITEHFAGIHIYAGKEPGDDHCRTDVSVFVPNNALKHMDWVCTLEGSPDEPSRCFVFKSRKELQDVIKALLVADKRLFKMEIDQLTNS